MHYQLRLASMLVVSALFSLQVSTGYAQSTADGSISDNTTWSESDSPVTVTDSVTVEEGATLTIEPEVEVEFENHTALIIEGVLDADGEEDQEIVFTSAEDSPEKGDWAGITFANSDDVGSTLSHVEIAYGGYGSTNGNVYYRSGAFGVDITHSHIHHSEGHGVNVRASSPLLDELTVENNDGYGVFSDTFSNFELTNSSVLNNDDGGARVPVNAGPEITDNTISGNDIGIYNDESAVADITDNTIEDNRVGMHFESLGSSLPEVFNNNMSGNDEYGIRRSDGATENLDAKRNFWGHQSGPYHPTSNPTGQGDQVDDFILYEPWSSGEDDFEVTEVTDDISEDETWDNGVYWVRNDIDVASNATLTIEPGVIVKFGSGDGIDVEGTMLAEGEEDNRIIFTSEKDDSYGGNTDGDAESVPEPGDWDQLLFESNNSVLEHAVIRYGGSSNGSLRIDDTNPDISNVYVNRSDDYGINLFSGDNTVTLDRVFVSHNNTTGIRINRSQRLELTNSEIFSNDGNGISSSTMGSRTGTVALLEDTEIYGNESRGVVNHNAEGEQIFRNNEIRDNERSGISVINLDQEEILFEDNLLEGNAEEGILSSSAQFVDNEFCENRYAIGIHDNVGNTYTDGDGNDGNIIEDNQFDDAIAIHSDVEGTIDTEFPEAISEPVYVAVERIDTQDHLTIDPGVIIKFTSGSGMRVDDELYAVGTEEDPIVFTSYRNAEWGGQTHDADESPEPGDWNVLEFRNNSSNDSRLEHAVISYGGDQLRFSEPIDEPVTNLEVTHADGNGVELRSDANITIENSVIEHNEDRGVYLFSNGTEATVRSSEIRYNQIGLRVHGGRDGVFREVANNIIEENDDKGIAIYNAETPQTFSGNTIRNNGEYGIWNNNHEAEAEDIQFIGNTLSGHDYEGIVSSRARFIDNEFEGNRYAIGVTGRLGNIYVDGEGDDGNIIEDNEFDNAVALHSDVYSTMGTTFPEAMPEPVYVAVERIDTEDDLTIDPGVIVKFSSGTGLRMDHELYAVGTDEDPIVFTSYRDTDWGGSTYQEDYEDDPEPGDWNSFEIRNNSSNDSRLEHAVFRYGDDQLRFSEPLNEPVTHLDVAYSDGHGIQLRSDAIITFEESVVENNDGHGIHLFSNGTEASVRNSEFRYNDGEALRSHGARDGAFREVSGNIIESNLGDGIRINEAEIPQTFTGNEIRENEGHGMDVNAMNDDVDTLMVINNNEVIDNEGVGIFTSRAHLTDNTMSGNQFGLGVQNQLSLEDTGNEEGFGFDGNEISDNTYPANAILMGDEIYGMIGHTLPDDIDEPVFVSLDNNISVDDDQELNVAAGSIFKLDGQRMRIDGRLIAEGNTEDKIIFTSWYDDSYGGDTNADDNETVPEPGDWGDLQVWGDHDDSYMNNVMVRYADDNLDIRNNDMVVDSLFSSNANSSGVFIRDASPTINYSEIHTNSTGVEIDRDSDPTIRQSNIRDNDNYGLDHDSDGTTTAINNYWGDETGPYHDDRNLEGEGNEVREQSGSVDFDPWLTDRTGILLGDVSESGNISAYDASMVLQFLVDAISLNAEQEEAADVSGTGEVTAMDASYILQYVVGKISGFPGMGRALPESEIAEAIEIETDESGSYHNLYINMTGELDISAAELTLDYDASSVNEIEWVGTAKSEELQTAKSDEDGKLKLAAAGTEALEDSGDFIHLRLHVDNDADLRDLYSLDHLRINEYDLTSEFDDKITSSPDEMADVPDEFKLGNNYPNPFNPVTTIPYQMPVSGEVTITIYNSVGQEVMTLENAEQDAGHHEIQWDASNVSSGMYLYRIEVRSEQADTFTDDGQMILVK